MTKVILYIFYMMITEINRNNKHMFFNFQWVWKRSKRRPRMDIFWRRDTW